MKPHGFYQACKVFGKNSTACEERDVDGTTVIEMALCPKQDMKVWYVYMCVCEKVLLVHS